MKKIILALILVSAISCSKNADKLTSIVQVGNTWTNAWSLSFSPTHTNPNTKVSISGQFDVWIGGWTNPNAYYLKTVTFNFPSVDLSGLSTGFYVLADDSLVNHLYPRSYINQDIAMRNIKVTSWSQLSGTPINLNFEYPQNKY